MVGTPVFGDQMANMDMVSNKYWGLRVDYKNLSEKSLDWALNEVLNNPMYGPFLKLIQQMIKFSYFFFL